MHDTIHGIKQVVFSVMVQGEAKRKILQGGVKISDKTVRDINYEMSELNNGKILKVGKREFRRIKI